MTISKVTQADADGIYLRGKTYWLAFQKNRKRTFISLETRDFAEAVRKAAVAKSSTELTRGSSLQEEAKNWTREKAARGDFTRFSVINATNAIRHIAALLGKNVTLGSVTNGQAQRIYELLRTRKSESTARSYCSYASSLMGWALEKNLVRSNPFLSIKYAKWKPVMRTEFCDADLRDRLIREAPSNELRFILYAGFHAGMRFAEIGEARPAWFNLTRRVIHIQKVTKTLSAATGLDEFDLKDREERTIPLSFDFAAFLQTQDLNQAYMLEPKKRRKKWKYRYDFKRPFSEYMDAQSCGWVTPHTMRRTFASLLASGVKVSLYEIAKLLGDDPRTTEKHYAHLLPDLSRFDAAFAPSSASASSVA